MRKIVVVSLLLTIAVATHSAQQPSTSPQSPAVTGRWIGLGDYLGTAVNFAMQLTQEGNKVTGDLEGDKLEGSLEGDSFHFVVKDDQGGSQQGTATVHGDAMSGTVTFIDSANPSHPFSSSFTAKLAHPVKHSGAPRRHEFVPATFYRQFSAANKPVLTVWPGDTIHTTTVDAGGTDEKGVQRVLGGNPETGPFFVEGAEPGDTLAVHIVHLRLNRDWAQSDDFVVGRAVDSELAVKLKDAGKNVRWHLDRQAGIATPEKPAQHLAHYSVALKPMLGCVGVAPSLESAGPGTGDSGRFGGNMDFNEIREGATVYLPVNVSGALLYVGDGHAAQGDGELNGNALETSMDVEFTVDVIPSKRIGSPRVESPTHIMAMGLAGSLDDAFRRATSDMADWLMTDYKLTASEAAQVLGTAAEYKISEVADRNAGVVLKISKESLKPLTPAEQ